MMGILTEIDTDTRTPLLRLLDTEAHTGSVSQVYDSQFLTQIGSTFVD
jgi:hypothetical protein